MPFFAEYCTGEKDSLALGPSAPLQASSKPVRCRISNEQTVGLPLGILLWSESEAHELELANPLRGIVRTLVLSISALAVGEPHPHCNAFSIPVAAKELVVKIPRSPTFVHVKTRGVSQHSAGDRD